MAMGCGELDHCVDWGVGCLVLQDLEDAGEVELGGVQIQRQLLEGNIRRFHLREELYGASSGKKDLS